MSETYQVYRHSGKFGLSGILLALAVAGAVGFPLGFVYAYAIKWIPFIYLNVLLTAGYGFVLGFVTAQVMKFSKARNVAIAALCGLLGGGVGLYLAWNGHMHSVFKDAPVFWQPAALWAGVEQLYEQGSWSFRGNDNVTGIVLGIVWAVEALIILGLSVMVPFGIVSSTPFCEQTQCWLDEEKKISTLEAFTDPAHLAAFQAFDLAPLSQAKPRAAGSDTFARLTLKHSPRCEQFCTVSVDNVTVTRNKDGNTSEKAVSLVSDLMLPKSMLALISKFEGFDQAKTEPPAEPPGEPATSA